MGLAARLAWAAPDPRVDSLDPGGFQPADGRHAAGGAVPLDPVLRSALSAVGLVVRQLHRAALAAFADACLDPAPVVHRWSHVGRCSDRALVVQPWRRGVVGVSPGAVLVFMLVGPATNIATVALVKRELGRRALYAYLGSVVGVGFAFGYLTNALAAGWGFAFVAQPQLAIDMSHSWFAYVASAVLAGLILRSVLSSWWRPVTAA